MNENVKIAALVGGVAVLIGAVWMTSREATSFLPPGTVPEDGGTSEPAVQRPSPVSIHSPRDPSPEPSATPDLPGGLFAAQARQMIMAYCAVKDPNLSSDKCGCIADWHLANVKPALVSFGVAQIGKASPQMPYRPAPEVEASLLAEAGITNRATALARLAEEEQKAFDACK